MSFNLKDICQKIFNLEEKYDLLNYQIDHVYIWQYIRFKIFNAISIQTKCYSIAHSKKVKANDILKAFPALFYHSLMHNPLTGNYHKDFLLFIDGKKILINNEKHAIYSSFFLKDIDKNKYDIIEEPYFWKHYEKTKSNQKNLDYIYFRSYFLNVFTKINLSEDNLNFIEKIENEINSYFSIKIDLKHFIVSGLKLFKNDYNYYKKILKKRKPKFVLLVFSYEKRKALIAACKDLNILSFEIQHGTVSKFHLGYHFPIVTKPLKYFPDYFISFGEFWRKNANFPIEDKNILIGGFPYFSIQKEMFSNTQKIEKQILFISQGTIGERLSELAFNVAKKLPDFNIIYKLHPGEYNRWKNEYSYLLEFQNLENAQVIDNNKTNLYRLFSEASYLVGVYSTAIFEGMSFGTKVFIVDLPGNEYMNKIIELNLAVKIKTADEFVENLDLFTNQEIQKNYFFNEDTDFSINKIYALLGIQY
ncbi:MAG: hypothetical protein K8R41_03015 [Bacteroidales bacterium]|nr:hypothetical protein [Bacteroidales bacterium]